MPHDEVQPSAYKGPDAWGWRAGRPAALQPGGGVSVVREDPAELVAALRKRADHDLPGALRACTEAVAAFPDVPLVETLRAELFIRIGRRDKGEIILKRLLEGRPTLGAARVALLNLLIEDGRIAEALETLRVPGWTARLAGKLLPALAGMAVEMGLPAVARQLIEEAGDPPPLGELKALAGEALAMDRAQGASGEDKRRHLLAMDALAHGRLQEADEGFTRLTADAPAYAPAWAGLRGARERLQRPAPELAGAPAAARPLLARRFGPRGLPFDPRESFPIRPRAQVLTEAGSTEALAHGSSQWRTLDAGGDPVSLRPVIPTGTRGDEIRVDYAAIETAMTVLDNAMVVGKGVVVTEQGELVRELFTHYSAHKFDAAHNEDGLRFDAHLFRDGLCPVEAAAGPAVLLKGPGDKAFGEWMINFLPRLATIAAAGVEAPLLVSRSAPRFVRLTLEAVGVDPRRIVTHDPTGVTVFPKLFVPSWPMPHRRAAMRDLFGALRIGPEPPAGGARRLIYLSREHMTVRPMVNEAQVRELFQRRGFEPVYPERLSLMELQAVLAEARCVAGPYGSGWLNLAFARARPACLVCAPPFYDGFLREVTLWLGSAGVDFGLALGAAASDEPVPNGPNEAPWTMPLDRLGPAIDALLDHARA